ncbi:MAG TPA: hypothetical protein DC047_18295 [Blastocatellia bacterium]|nr:hypothetical protein [Blastocatellia bacterium]
MKATDKNEMDLLLRALGRDAATRSETGSSQSRQETGAHLDADELNCYAEGLVSSAERLRYNKHLADCDRCRGIVAGLVPAMRRQHDAVKPETGWSLREKLAALFAPSVLRFAMPALALTAIIAIAIVALRRPQQSDFVAQNQEQTSPAESTSAGSQKTTANDGPQSIGAPAEQQQLAESKEKNVLSERRSAIQPPAVVPKTGASTTTTDRAAKGFVQPRESMVAQSQPTFAAEPSDVAAPPPPRPASIDASKAAEARKQEDDADMQKRRRDDNFSQSRSENELARGGPAKGGPSRNNSSNVGGLSSVTSRAANKDEKAAGNAVETRRVSGRLFHREGSGWVDSDYASGRAIVNVKRGSEQFRALVADEPALRSIAEQLGGEVIVVWKGTAYRIR